MKNLITTKEAAAKAGYALATFRNHIMSDPSFPAARGYGEHGIKLFAWAEIESWLREKRKNRIV